MSNLNSARRQAGIALGSLLLLLIVLGIFIGGAFKSTPAMPQPHAFGPMERLSTWVEPPKPKRWVYFTDELSIRIPSSNGQPVQVEAIELSVIDDAPVPKVTSP